MMIIEQKEAYILVSSNDDSLTDFISNFKNEHPIFEKKNVIVLISENFKAKEEDIFVFLPYARKHLENGTTFVVIYNNVDVDSFPEEFNIVPTLQEAEDILEMEVIQRDLGF